MGSKEKIKRHNLILLILFLFSLIKTVFFSRYGFGLVDEGESLHNALRILGGEIPYRDFYSPLFPLDTYWGVVAFKLFGVSAFSPRLLSSIVFSFLPPVLFLIASKIMQKKYALVSCILIVFMDVNVERLYFFTPLFIGFFLFLTFLKNNEKVKVFLSGLAIGIASLVRVDMGLAFSLGIYLAYSIHLISLKKGFNEKANIFLETVFYFSLGFLLPISLLFCWLYSKGILTEFYQATILSPVEVTKNYSLPLPSFFSLFPEEITISSLLLSYRTFLTYLILAVYLFSAALLLKGGKSFWKKQPVFLFVFSVGLMLLPYALGRNDIGHLLKGGLPFLILGSYIISKFSFKKIALFVPFIILIASLVQNIWWINFNSTAFKTRYGTIRINSEYTEGSTLVTSDTLVRTIEFISKEEKDFMTAPYMAGVYFLVGKRSQTYFDNIFAGYLETRGGEKEFIKELENLKMERLVYDPQNGPESDISSLKSYYPHLHEYFLDNYEVEYTSPEGWMFMIKE